MLRETKVTPDQIKSLSNTAKVKIELALSSLENLLSEPLPDSIKEEVEAAIWKITAIKYPVRKQNT